MRKILPVLFALLTTPLAAQTPLKQSGTVTPTHGWCITTNGIAQDCGTAAIPFLSTLGTVGQGDTICAWSALSTSGASQKICLGANTTTGADITVQNFGTAAAKNLTFNLNGIAYPFPGTGNGNVVGPTPTVIGDIPSWNNTVGTLLSDPANITSNAQDFYFGTGRPWCDIRANGGVSDSSTDNAPAFSACQTKLAALGGGIIYVPPSGAGLYCIKTLVTISTNGISIVGASPLSSQLSACGVDAGVFKLTGSRDEIARVQIYGKGVNNDTGTFGATKPVIQVTGNGSFIHDLLVFGGSHPIELDAGETWLYNIYSASQGYGSANLYSVAGGFFYNVGVDQVAATPNSCSYNYRGTTWATSTLYTCGDVVTVTVGGTVYNIQAQTTGTSSGTLGQIEANVKNYGINFFDNGGVNTWQLLGPQTFYGAQIDTGAGENVFSFSDFSGSQVYTAGIAMTNTLSGVVPNYLECSQCIISGISKSLDLVAGSHAHLSGGSFFVTFEGTWAGEYANDNGLNGSFRFSYIPQIYGGGGTGSGFTLQSTSNGSPSGDTGNLYASTINFGPTAGTSNLAQLTWVGAAQFAVGKNGTVGGQLTINAAASGQIIQQAGAANIGNPTISWGNTSGTPAVTASAPLAINSSTGNISLTSPLPIANGGTAQTSIAGIQAATNQGLLTFEISGVNFNSANTDNAINITLPTGFSRYRILSMIISGASASISTATFGVFSGTGGTGTVIVNSATAITVTASAENTANNMQFITVNNNNTASYNFSSIQFRVVGAQGSAATANVAISIQPVS